MAKIPAPSHSSGRLKFTRARFALLAAAVLLAIPAGFLVAQDSSPRVTSVDPATGKVSDEITASGENLDKAHVSAVFLSDEKDDHKATVVTQAADKIVLKVPAVRPGDYNVSIQSGNSILIQPVRFTVQ